MKIDKQVLIDAVESSNTMAKAAVKTGLHFNTFKRYTVELGIYNPNQGGKYEKKPKAEGKNKIPLLEILEGLHPSYQTFKLKNRLYGEGLKENKCERCEISEWNNELLQCELEHIDGNRSNHKFENLMILCPNCHSQTSTFRSKKRI